MKREEQLRQLMLRLPIKRARMDHHLKEELSKSTNAGKTTKLERALRLQKWINNIEMLSAETTNRMLSNMFRPMLNQNHVYGGTGKNITLTNAENPRAGAQNEIWNGEGKPPINLPDNRLYSSTWYGAQPNGYRDYYPVKYLEKKYRGLGFNIIVDPTNKSNYVSSFYPSIPSYPDSEKAWYGSVVIESDRYSLDDEVNHVSGFILPHVNAVDEYHGIMNYIIGRLKTLLPTYQQELETIYRELNISNLSSVSWLLPEKYSLNSSSLYINFLVDYLKERRNGIQPYIRALREHFTVRYNPHTLVTSKYGPVFDNIMTHHDGDGFPTLHLYDGNHRNLNDQVFPRIDRDIDRAFTYYDEGRGVFSELFPNLRNQSKFDLGRGEGYGHRQYHFALERTSFSEDGLFDNYAFALPLNYPVTRGVNGFHRMGHYDGYYDLVNYERMIGIKSSSDIRIPLNDFYGALGRHWDYARYIIERDCTRFYEEETRNIDNFLNAPRDSLIIPTYLREETRVKNEEITPATFLKLYNEQIVDRINALPKWTAESIQIQNWNDIANHPDWYQPKDNPARWFYVNGGNNFVEVRNIDNNDYTVTKASDIFGNCLPFSEFGNLAVMQRFTSVSDLINSVDPNWEKGEESKRHREISIRNAFHAVLNQILDTTYRLKATHVRFLNIAGQLPSVTENGKQVGQDFVIPIWYKPKITLADNPRFEVELQNSGQEWFSCGNDVFMYWCIRTLLNPEEELTEEKVNKLFDRIYKLMVFCIENRFPRIYRYTENGGNLYSENNFDDVMSTNAFNTLPRIDFRYKNNREIIIERVNVNMHQPDPNTNGNSLSDTVEEINEKYKNTNLALPTENKTYHTPMLFAKTAMAGKFNGEQNRPGETNGILDYIDNRFRD